MLTVNIHYQHPTSTAQLAQANYRAAFTVAAGQCLGIMGPSGAGKTTLLHAIAGLLNPTAGEILVHGTVWYDGTRAIHLAPHQRPVGLVFQEGRLFPHLSVEQNLRYGMPRRATPTISLHEVIDILAIKALLQRTPSQLSGGERQRVALGRALLSQPQILLMDEPLSGLDAALKQQVLPYIQQVIQRFSMPTIYVSHAQDEIARVADQVRVMDHGVLGQARPVIANDD